MRRLVLPLVATLPLALLGCPPAADDDVGEGEGEGEGEEGVPVSIPFVGLVDGVPFACAGDFVLGSDAVDVTFLDARFYVQDVVLIAGADFRPVTLDENAFQRGRVALMDFENGDTDSCDTGSVDTHTTLTGRVSSLDGVTGISFLVGVPEDQNHLDVATAASPLDVQAMYWSWTGGYKFLKVDVAVDASGRTSFFHLGSSVCAGEPGLATCQNQNRVAVELDGFAVDKGVAIDFARIFDGIALDEAPVADDPVKGCMSGPTDPECTTSFSQLLGLNHGEVNAVGPQSLFTAVP
jgi:uncharacterized repeat protein (TIGR04052 family)